jgi:hypothetical protein
VKDDLKQLIQEIATRFSLKSDKVLIMQASKNVVCCGVYKGKEIIHAAIIIHNRELKKWEVIEGDKAKETTFFYFAYLSNLFDLVESHIEGNKEEFGINIDQDFLSD